MKYQKNYTAVQGKDERESNGNATIRGISQLVPLETFIALTKVSGRREDKMKQYKGRI